MGSNLKYRSEIDGLRSLAVLGVVIFHAKLQFNDENVFFSGGFLGVDVFFVISGFLITSIIHQELLIGKFSVSRFYLRRARRLLPALFIVLLACLPFSWMLFTLQEMIDFSQSILSTTFFYSNFLFWSENPYWATANELKPLLHTWSLAVEEQYYLFIPLLFIILFKYQRTRTIFWFFVIGIASFVLVITHTPKFPDATFYMLPFRAWELIAGGITAFISMKKRKIPYWISSLSNPISIVVIVLCFLFVSEDDLHPYFITLIPVFATCTFILTANKNETVTKIISSRIFVGIGLISYPLYLWHYPIFSFANIANISLTTLDRFGLIFVSVLLAYLTFVLIEKPIRSTTTSKSIFLTPFIVIFFLPAVFALQGISTNGYKQRLGEIYSLYKNAEPSNRILQRETWKPQQGKKSFAFSDTKILIHGDSHAKDMFNSLVINKALIPGFDFLRSRYSFSDNKTKTCFASDKDKINALLKSDIYKSADLVIISDAITESWNVNCLGRYLKNVDTKKKKYLIFSTQQFNFPDEISKKVKAKVDTIRSLNKLANLYYARFPLRTVTISDLVLLSEGEIKTNEGEKMQYNSISEDSISVNRKIRELAFKHKIKFINKYDYLCDQKNKSCKIFDEKGRKIYFDNSHLTIAGATLMGKRIISILNEISLD